MSEVPMQHEPGQEEPELKAQEPLAAEPEALANPASAMLLEARSRAGFTQKEVADQLFLMTSFIRYIDEGKFDKIPKPAFVKGYLRSYARVVDLSGDEVIAVFEASQQVAQDDIEIKDVTDEPMGSSTYTGPVFLTGAVGFAGVVLVALLIWIFSDSEEGSSSANITSAGAANEAALNSAVGGVSSDEFDMTSEELEVLQLPSRTINTRTNGQNSTQGFDAFRNEVSGENRFGGVSVTESSLDEPNTSEADQIMHEDEEMAAVFDSISVLPDQVEERVQDELEQEASVVAVNEQTVASQSLESLRAITRELVVENGREVTKISAGGSDELFFEFTDDCWLEVEDAEGVAIYGDLNRSGDALRINGVAPYSVLLGKAPGVSVRFNGETVDVARYTTADETAKLRLN